MSFDNANDVARIQLPARETEILAMAARGLTDKQIAAELGISRDTVGTYWRRILLRYKASSRTEVVARATEQALKGKVSAAEQESARLMQEIHERSEAQAEALDQRNLLAAVHEALLGFISKSPDPEVIFQNLLRELLVLTQGEFGFISEVSLDRAGAPAIRNLAISNIAWDKESQEQYEQELTRLYHACDRSSLIGSIITSRVPVISNAPAKDSRSKGVPEGHKPIQNFIGIPLVTSSEIVGMIGVANRQGGFTEQTIADLAPITTTCVAIISGIKTELRRSAAEAEAAKTIAQLSSYLDSIDSMVMLVDNDGTIKAVNRAFCNEFLPDLKPHEVIGLRSADMLEKSSGKFFDKVAHVQLTNNVIDEGKIVRGLPVVTADGRRFLCDFYPLQESSQPIGRVWQLNRVQ